MNTTVDQRMRRTIHGLLSVVRAMLWGDDAGYVHRIVEQRRGRLRRKRKRVVRWEKHEAHIIAIEEDEKVGDESHDSEQGSEEKAGGKEEKESEAQWWREHEPCLTVPQSMPAWCTSERNTREEQLPDRADKSNTPERQQQPEQKQQ